MTSTQSNLRVLPERLQITRAEREAAKSAIGAAMDMANMPVLINIFQELLLDDLADLLEQGSDWTPEQQNCFDKLNEAVDTCLFPDEKE